jgi:isopentenyl diphosphate isomerase/L-lactate dehydrogenase-like FMN-dependent dehydrogenase
MLAVPHGRFGEANGSARPHPASCERRLSAVVLGPVGMAGMYSSRGEVKVANAAKAVGVPFTLSTMGVCDVHEVAQKTGVPLVPAVYAQRPRFRQERDRTIRYRTVSY